MIGEFLHSAPLAALLVASLHMGPGAWLSEDAAEPQPEKQTPIEAPVEPNPPGPADGAAPAVVGPNDKPIEGTPDVIGPADGDDDDDSKSDEQTDENGERVERPHTVQPLPAKICVPYLVREVHARLNEYTPGLGARGTYGSEWFIRLDPAGRVNGVVPVQAFTEEIFATFMGMAFKKPFKPLCHGVYLMRVAWTPSGWFVQLPRGRR